MATHLLFIFLLGLVACKAHLLAHTQPMYLAACLLARDGHQDLREWVEYHLYIGVDKIFLFDHNSTKPMLNDIADYVTEGKVQYTYFTSDSPRVGISQFSEGLQGRVFQQCFEQARPYFTWLAFTDLDEFIIITDPKYNDNLPAILREHEDAGAVMMHWQRLGSMGVQSRTREQGMLDTFTKCMAVVPHVKGIANLRYTTVGPNAHMFRYQKGKYGVRPGDGATVVGTHAIENPITTPLVVYHYNGAVSEWQDRLNRMKGGVSGLSMKKSVQYEIIDRESTLDCTAGREAARRVPRRPLPV